MIDFNKFEDTFKLGLGLPSADEVDHTPKNQRKMSKKPETISLLDPNRMRNTGKSARTGLVHTEDV